MNLLIYQYADEFKENLNLIEKKIPFDDIEGHGKDMYMYNWPSLEDGDYVLIHFGGVEELPHFCKEIKEWKAAIKSATEKEVIILPISRLDNVRWANTLYIAAENNHITQKILEESKRFWENECKAVPKIEVIAELLGLSILIDGAEAAKKRNDTLKLEEMKKEIIKELKDLRDIEGKIIKVPDDEWPDSLKKSLQEIINASEKLFTPTAPKTPVQIYKDIKDLKNKLQESQK